MPSLDLAAKREDLSTKQRIIRSGLMLFQAHGYHGTGIAMIIGDAGVPKGSFYHHFPGGKEELAVATLAWLQSEVHGYLDERARKGASFRAMVLGIAKFTAAGLRGTQLRRGSLLSVLAQDAIPESATITATAQHYTDGIKQRLMLALKKEGSAAAWAEQALALLQGGAVLARIEGNPNLAIEIVESWLDTVDPLGKKQ